ncbi:ferredoxin [Puniceibacterium confluentis]|uniref:ferredoxin n=1 Tax=Puniceibacterium confluentis TaxID=1958944 RepID=UPI0011B4DB36|nr:ferredoxin [Puniceibacterium confluentis]
MTLAAIEVEAQAHALTIRGAIHPVADPHVPADCQTLVMLGPDEPAFWQVFAASAEHGDGQPDPLDRWSRRVVGSLAEQFGGQAILPSDGPPYPPFLRWARATGRCWTSPTGLLVHDTAGLMLSFRGALALPLRLGLSPRVESPCLTCADRPCTSVCPIGALGTEGAYDVPACQTYLATDAGQDCRLGGCLVRRACPVSSAHRRDPAQAAFHMAAFVKD